MFTDISRIPNYYYIIICALVIKELFVTSQELGCDKNSHSILCLINVLYTVCVAGLQ